MKTLCAWDNVACIVDNFPQSLDSVVIPFFAICGAIVIAIIFANKMKG